MAQRHSSTKRNRRQISHTRGHEGRETQLALRSPEAVEAARKQDNEVANYKLQVQLNINLRKDLKNARRTGKEKPNA